MAARLVLLGVALAGVAIVAIALLQFAPSPDRRRLVWMAAGISAMLLGLAGRRLRPVRQVGLALSAVLGCASLVGIEAVFTAIPVVREARLQAAVSELSGHPFDRRSIPQVIAERRAAGEPIVPEIVPKVVAEYSLPRFDARHAFRAPFFPLAGVSRSLTLQLCREDGRYPDYVSDRHGFRNPAALWDSLPMSLVLIGDSFTAGYCVPDDSAIAGQLRARWPRTLNLGTGGSGPLAELATLTEYGLAARPRLVLWFLFENDLSDLALESRHPILKRYLEPDFNQGLRGRQEEIDTALRPWVDRLYASDAAPREAAGGSLADHLLLGATRRAIRAVAKPTGIDTVTQDRMLRDVLTEAGRRTKASGARLVFVFLPQWGRFFGDAGRADDMRRRVALAVAVAVAHDSASRMIDLTDPFTAHPSRDSLFGRGALGPAHYSPRGYALVARTVADALDSLGLSPP